MEKLKHILEFTPAFDKRTDNPETNYGIGCLNMRFVVKGAKGAVQFLLMTGWYLRHNVEELERNGKGGGIIGRPIPADLGYHSPVPMHEGQEPMGSKNPNYDKMKQMMAEFEKARRTGNQPEFVNFMEPTGTFTPCPYLDGKPCYYDGSSLAADKVFDILCEKGDTGVFEFLEAEYHQVFGQVEVKV